MENFMRDLKAMENKIEILEEKNAITEINNLINKFNSNYKTW